MYRLDGPAGPASTRHLRRRTLAGERNVMRTPRSCGAEGACRFCWLRSAEGNPERVLARARVSAIDTVGCDLVAIDAHPDPEVLLDEFVRRDAAGEFISASPWFNQAVSCLGYESAADEAIMARPPTLSAAERLPNVRCS